MVFHDMFDSFNEHQEFWQNQIKSLENVRIIIFNYPGNSLNQVKPILNLIKAKSTTIFTFLKL